jgi:hypothetical protein
VIFFLGDEDAVVPPSQSEAMVEELRRKGIAVGYFLFSGEQHGFRKSANIQRCLDAELAFYTIEVFKIGLTLWDVYSSQALDVAAAMPASLAKMRVLVAQTAVDLWRERWRQGK